MICQKITAEPLRCPLNASGLDKSAPAAYGLFIENVTHFKELNSLPVPVKFSSDIKVEDLIRNQAQWHKTCHSYSNSNRLERVRKRKREATPEGRQQRPRQPLIRPAVYFALNKMDLFMNLAL